MTSILIILLAFVATTIQLVRSNRAKEGEPQIGGLHRTAAIILLISTAGLILGVAKELQAAKGARENAQNLKEMDTLLKTTAAKLDGIGARLPGGAVKEEVQNLRDRLSAPFSTARMSNLKGSDFEYSILSNGNFSYASFQDSLFDTSYFGHAVFRHSAFDGADFRGVDLRNAIFDETTLLPPHK